jgi:hypothetical protein
MKVFICLIIAIFSLSVSSAELNDYEKILLPVSIIDPKNQLIDNSPLTKEEIIFYKKECYFEHDFEYNLYNCVRIQEKIKNVVDQLSL